MADAAAEWVDVPAPEPVKAADGWENVPPAEPAISEAAMPGIKAAVEPVLNAFGQGFREGWGPDRLGLPDEDVKWLSKAGIFAPEGAKGYDNPFHAFNELLAQTIYTTPEILLRGGNALFRGGQAAVAETGEQLGQPQLGRDIAAIPEAFLGSPHPTGTFKVPALERPVVDLPAARDLGVIGPEPRPISEGTPVEAARNAVPDRAVAAGQAPDAKVTQEVGRTATDKAGNIRLDLIEVSNDAEKVIRTAAEEAGGPDAFMPARRGEIPLAQADALSQVTGIPAEELNLKGIGRVLRNDDMVRTYITAMIQSSEETAAAMKKAALTDDPADLIDFQRLRMRHSALQEQVAGLTAEWGRTGNVFQEFAERAKDAKGLGDFLKEKKGETIDDLRNMVRAGSELDPRTQLPRFLNDARTPSFWDKAIFYWVNSLISGPITHLKYVGANAAYAGYEAAIVTPLAATFGTARKLVGSATAADRVLHGETAARLWGLVAGTPDAFVAAYKAAKSGLQTPLPGEIAQNIIPKQNKNVFFQQAPIPGTIGQIISAPSKGASAIHSFFNFLGYRASLEQQAYRATIKEGHSPVDEAFWRRRGEIADKPTTEMMDKSIEEGYRLTFITKLGPAGRKIAAAVNGFPPLRLVMPFMHIPFNILKEATNNTALAVFSKEMREDIGGKNGVAAQDTALARVVAGSALGAWMVNLAANDRATGYGPTDPKERALWLLTHQPYSLRIGSYWVSYNRFGPVGTLLGLHANLADALPHMKWDGEEATKAAALLVHSTGRLMEDEVGMQGLAGIMDAINEPERKGTRFVSNFVGSWMPFSSLQKQTASVMDPQMREAKTFIDGLLYNIPVVREGLLPRRDWTGTPVPNPGYHSVLRTAAVNEDFLSKEMQALDIKPTPPQDRIGGVKLTAKLYDEYQSTAGPFTRQALEGMVSNPGWHDLPPYIRETTIKATIKSTREAAAAAMQAAHPEIIRQGMQDRIDHLAGKKPTKKLAAD